MNTALQSHSTALDEINSLRAQLETARDDLHLMRMYLRFIQANYRSETPEVMKQVETTLKLALILVESDE